MSSKPAFQIEVLHAAETGIGGINSIIVGLGTRQVGRLGEGSVHVLVPRNHAADFRETSLVSHVFERRSRSLRSFLGFIARFSYLVLKYRPSFIILHSSFAGFAGRIVLFSLRSIHRPVVIYCAHGWAFTMAVSEWRKCLYASIERQLTHLSSAVVNISEAEHGAALRAGLPPHRLHLIPNGTPRAPVDPGRSPYPPHLNKMNLLFVGRLDRQKGIDLLVSILADAPQLPIALTVIGRAVTDPVELKWSPNVRYIDWLHPRDLPPYYAHADAVVVPSRWEGFGLVAAEALSFGTPVIASRIGGLATLVEDGVSGFLFDPTSAGELLQVLSGLDRELLRKMRAAALLRWEQVADLQDMEMRYFQLMQSLAPVDRHVMAITSSGDVAKPAVEVRRSM